jgi:DNA adenine methylase
MKPFCKWVGGKRQLLPIIQENTPTEFKTYFEPFLGGGAVLLGLAPKKAIISDYNSDLITTWKIIRDDLDNLIKHLSTHKNNKEYFLDIRQKDVNLLTNLERASRFIYLNKTCFNGIYRVNQKGQFNVPFGSYKNPQMLEVDNAREVSSYLQQSSITIMNKSYLETLSKATAQDFIYLDPPYHPLSETASFTSYTDKGFNEKDQENLANIFKSLSAKGCYCMLSNSNCAFIRNLYSDFNITELMATRAVAAKSSSRTKAKVELLITNY